MVNGTVRRGVGSKGFVDELATDRPEVTTKDGHHPPWVAIGAAFWPEHHLQALYVTSRFTCKGLLSNSSARSLSIYR